jgi:hypothetical protein
MIIRTEATMLSFGLDGRGSCLMIYDLISLQAPPPTFQQSSARFYTQVGSEAFNDCNPDTHASRP